MIFLFPKEVKSNYGGYATLVRLYYSFFSQNSEFSELKLDFRDTYFFEANLCAVLGAILSKVSENNNTIIFLNLKPKVESIFTRNHFLSYFGGQILPDYNSTTIKFKKFEVVEDKQFKAYLDNELLTQQDLPQMTLTLRKEISKSMFEIFSNADIHGKSKYVFCCGQYYPRLKKIDFTIVDLGRTIRYNVREYLQKPLMSAKEAIEWAVKEGNTTKTGNIPGGLGLSLIRKFISLNQGDFQIISSDGFLSETKGHLLTMDLESDNEESMNFMGTIVNLQFNIKDTKSYQLSSEQIDPDDIF